MADLTTEHYATEYSANWESRVQQMNAKLDSFVVDINFSGERKRFDRINKMTAQERTSRKAPTPVTDADTDSRWCHRRTFDLANVLAEEDSRNLAPLVLPTSEYVKQHAYSYHRTADQVALRAAIGNVITGEDGTTETALGSGQLIAASATGLTIAKLLNVLEILNGHDIVDEPNSRVLVVGPKQITTMLNTTEVKSADYNTVKALAQGQIDTFMGFKWIISNLLETSGSDRYCIAWVKGAIKRVKGGLRTTIDRLPQQSNATQILSMFDMSATRVYDEGVVRIACAE
jgi:hypothetical protein